MGSRGENHSLFRGGGNHYRGKDWKEQASATRERDGHVCQGCDKSFSYKLSVDHVVPYRLAKQIHEEDATTPSPNNLLNLISLCRGCHGKKLVPEAKILAGDVLGFIAGVKQIFTLDVIERALIAFKLVAA